MKESIMNKTIQNTLKKIGPPISKMISMSQVEFILENINNLLEKNIDGDLVELGCNVGTTSLYIQNFLNEFKSAKTFHVYDSFEGLPNMHINDKGSSKNFSKGSLKTSLVDFANNFSSKKVPLPHIHIGWFGDIPQRCYPEQISFAFLDGDFYSSIIESLEKVYPKLTEGGIILVHDYEWGALPGPKKACDDFFKDKEEKVIYENNFIGKIIKN